MKNILDNIYQTFSYLTESLFLCFFQRDICRKNAKKGLRKLSAILKRIRQLGDDLAVPGDEDILRGRETICF